MTSYKGNFQEGERVLLEMQCGDVFEGELVNVAENFLELINVKQHNNVNSLQSVYTFYRNEIERIFKFKNIIATKNEELIDKKVYRYTKITKKEYDDLNSICQNFIFMENADSRYYNAIKDLENSETIGVVFLGVLDAISTGIKLIGMCTLNQVYIFDLADIKQRNFYPELKNIFESKYVCKVFHGGMSCIDILYRNYGVYATNVFDTQIVDLLIEKHKAGGTPPDRAKSLTHCIKVYLNLPPSLLKTAQGRTAAQWSERPLGEMDKIYAAQLCFYSLKLQQVMKQVLFQNIFTAVDNVHEHIGSLNETEFEIYAKSNVVSEGVNKLIPSLQPHCSTSSTSFKSSSESTEK